MRVYPSPSASRLLSTVLLITSLGLLGLVLWKAVDTWRADPSLQQMQELLNRQEP